ncbi:acyl-CoA dehydrogenase family protein [Streptosporangium sp. NPDC006013]|uniref:acyl-CoA dehydrogenase family protein n=1 Tax=Streptosporangium sp. NPDC006013 TaxID=3155596 RepID=UPI0033A53BB3
MYIDLTPEERELQREADAYFAGVVTEQERAQLHEDEFGPAYRAVSRRLGRDGWLGLGWPEEHGGRGLGPMADQIVVSTAFRYEVPYPLVTVYSVGPALQEFGTPEQQREFLPRILAGDLQVSIGYSEPGSGTDLASLTTSARRDGDSYVVNGQKMFISGAHTADYLWLACRTDPEEPRTRGISILLLDTALPGVSWTPIRTLNRSHQVNAVYFDDVRVPADRLIGRENKGWSVVVGQLNSERFIVGPAGKIQAHLDRLRHWAAETPLGGPGGRRRMADLPEVRRALAELDAIVTANELLNWRIVADTGTGTLGAADASVNKLYNSERLVEAGARIAQLVQRYGDPADELTAAVLRDTDHAFKTELKLPVGGGVSEIQRELIATVGLGLPRAPR